MASARIRTGRVMGHSCFFAKWCNRKSISNSKVLLQSRVQSTKFYFRKSDLRIKVSFVWNKKQGTRARRAVRIGKSLGQLLSTARCSKQTSASRRVNFDQRFPDGAKPLDRGTRGLWR